MRTNDVIPSNNITESTAFHFLKYVIVQGIRQDED